MSKLKKDKPLSTESLKMVLRFINYIEDEDESRIKELLSIGSNALTTVITTFYEELNQNLLNSKTKRERKDLISDYIWEFLDYQAFFKEYREIIPEGKITFNDPSLGEFKYPNNDEEKRQLDELRNYVILSHCFFDVILECIQCACIRYYIDFYEICERLKFDITLFDTHTTKAFKDRANQGKLPQTSQQTEEKQDGKNVKHRINYEVFEKALGLINYYFDYNEDLMEELLSIKYNMFTILVDPFKAELNQNLLNSETEQDKKSLISYYVSQFLNLQTFFERNHKVIFEGKTTWIDFMVEFGHINSAGKKILLDKYEKYIFLSHVLFNQMLRYIQVACITYYIDFNEICNRLKLNTAIFDTHITEEFINRTKPDKQNSPSGTNNEQHAIVVKPKTQLTLPQIALIHFYNSHPVTRQNMDEIAENYGLKSGERLYHLFTKYAKNINRICPEETQKKNDNKLALFEAAISNLSGKAKKSATDEMNSLKEKIVSGGE